MSEASTLCLSCGLCCDGSLIGYVELSREEIPALKEIMEIEDESNHGFFLQPCPKFCNSCTIYEQRPKSCNNFNCRLLKDVQEEVLSFEAAHVAIKEVKKRKLALQEKIASLPLQLLSPSFYFQVVELKKWIAAQSKESLDVIDKSGLAQDLKELDQLLSEKFGLTLN